MTLPPFSQNQGFQTPDVQTPDSQSRDPVTLVVRRRVRPGQEPAFETLVSGVSSTLAGWPGHLGTGVVRPVPGQREYTLVVRFADAATPRAGKPRLSGPTGLPRYRRCSTVRGDWSSSRG